MTSASRKILVLFAHPRLDRSSAHAQLMKVPPELPGVTFVDLYAKYPRFDIDVDAEQARLLEHDVVVFQFPVYWYSTPSILKEWQDLVLEYGFAYGTDARALEGKLFMTVVTTGGARQAYCKQGYQHHELRELLVPLEQTANLCKMIYLPPFVLYDAGQAAADGRLRAHTARYAQLLEALRDGNFDVDAATTGDRLTLEVEQLVTKGV